MLTDLQYLCRTLFTKLSPIQPMSGYAKISCRNLFSGKAVSRTCKLRKCNLYSVQNGTPLGYLKLNIGNAQTEKCLDNALEIQRIYILKSAKGQGIGSAFMQIAENFASEKKLQQYGSVCGNITSLQRNSTNQKDMKNFHITHLSSVRYAKPISFWKKRNFMILGAKTKKDSL